MLFVVWMDGWIGGFADVKWSESGLMQWFGGLVVLVVAVAGSLN